MIKQTRIVKGMTLAHTTEDGTKVYVSRIYNRANLMNGLKVIVVDANYNCSEAKEIFRCEDVTAKIAYLDNIADLTANDVAEIAKFIHENFNKIKILKTKDKMNCREVFQILYSSLEDYKEEHGYYIVETKKFNETVKGCGWVPLRFKKILLEADILKPSAGRIYDYNRRIKENGEQKNTWWLRIDAKALEEEAALSSVEKEVVQYAICGYN
ncbi:hypothetical protein ACJDU8_02010 [Clostridium sp. WILCCON 0269]|uniref:Uncharacterized protein n=1 Tax=Candidatus Clostridium eludens TaxID=3381663 RepID=A0ABW8SHL4_9CLOT